MILDKESFLWLSTHFSMRLCLTIGSPQIHLLMQVDHHFLINTMNCRSTPFSNQPLFVISSLFMFILDARIPECPNITSLVGFASPTNSHILHRLPSRNQTRHWRILHLVGLKTFIFAGFSTAMFDYWRVNHPIHCIYLWLFYYS